MLRDLGKEAGRQRLVAIRTEDGIIAHAWYIWGFPVPSGLRLGLLVWLRGKKVVAQLAQLSANALESWGDCDAGELEGGGRGAIAWGGRAGIGVVDGGRVDGVHAVSGDLGGGRGQKIVPCAVYRCSFGQ